MEFTEHDNNIIIKVPVTAETITSDIIKHALAEAGFARCYVLQNQLDNLLAEYQFLQQKVKDLTLAANSKTLSYPIAEKRNAQLSFEIAEDKMMATAFISPAWGGGHVSANDLVKAAQQLGIVFGFHKENIIRLVQQASRTEPGQRLKAEIAFGRQVKPGLDSCFEPQIPDMVYRRNQPLVSSDSKADLRDFGAIPAVVKGQILMRRYPPTPGEQGVDVTGQITAPIPGSVIDWQLGTGTEVSPDDPDLLLASHDGLPRAVENGAVVDEVFTVKNVDLSSGHIIFKGSVIVTGNVIAGMKVIAGGNVFIKGVMEGSLIEAGGDITVSGSIIGHQVAQHHTEPEYTTVLKAAGNIFCHIAQYSALLCQGQLQVTKYLMHCAVEADSLLAGTADKLNGKIIGGNYLLATTLQCGQLGSPSSGAVLVKLNRQLYPIIQQQETLRTQLAQVKQMLDELHVRLENHKKMLGGKADDQQLLLEQEFNEQKQLTKGFISEIRQLEEQRIQVLPQLGVKVTQQLFSAVEIQFGKDVFRSRREYGPSLIKIEEGHPSINPL